MLSNGSTERLIPTYATLNAARSRTFRPLLRLIVLMSCGSTRSYPSISPVWSACRRAALSGIARKMRRLRLGLRPQ